MWLFREIKYWAAHLSPRLVMGSEYWKFFRKWPRMRHPRDLNEKIIWTLFHRDRALWARLADKVAVRDYAKEKGLAHLLVPVQGVWESADDIDFSTLTPPYVLKPNNGTQANIYVRQGDNPDFEAIRRRLRRAIRRPFGYDTAQMHYVDIPRRIIAEDMLDASKQAYQSPSLIDYKVLCFNGEPDSILAFYNRNSETFKVTVELWSTDWQPRTDEILTAGDEIQGRSVIPRPKHLAQMLDAARILADGLPQCRVDFYEVDGRLYLGEITLTGAGGHIPYLTPESLMRMGQKIILPIDER